VTVIKATLLDSAGVPLPAGTTITLTLDDPRLGSTSVSYPVPRTFTVAGIDGKVSLDVPPTELTTRFVVALPGGTILDDFRATIPDSATPLEFSTLVRRGIADSQLPSTLRRLLEELRSDPNLSDLLTPLRNRGTYQTTDFYTPWDVVFYDGGSWVLRENSGVVSGVSPSTAPQSPWLPLAQRGATGTGTSGNPTGFDRLAWTNQGDAPSRGALAEALLDRRNPLVDIVPTLGVAALDPLRVVPVGYLRENFIRSESPTLMGDPRCPTKGVGDATTSIANCNHVKTTVDTRLGDLGTLAPTISDNRAVSAAWVRNLSHEFNYSGNDVVTAGAGAWTTFNLATVTTGKGLTMELGGVKVNATGFYLINIEGYFTLGASGTSYVIFYALDLGGGAERGVGPVFSGGYPFTGLAVPCSYAVGVFLTAGTLIKPKAFVHASNSVGIPAAIQRFSMKQVI
jgi:hypothetical protein